MTEEQDKTAEDTLETTEEQPQPKFGFSVVVYEDNQEPVINIFGNPPSDMLLGIAEVAVARMRAAYQSNMMQGLEQIVHDLKDITDKYPRLADNMINIMNKMEEMKTSGDTDSNSS